MDMIKIHNRSHDASVCMSFGVLGPGETRVQRREDLRTEDFTHAAHLNGIIDIMPAKYETGVDVAGKGGDETIYTVGAPTQAMITACEASIGTPSLQEQMEEVLARITLDDNYIQGPWWRAMKRTIMESALNEAAAKGSLGSGDLLEDARKILGFKLESREYGDLHAYFVEEWEAESEHIGDKGGDVVGEVRVRPEVE